MTWEQTELCIAVCIPLQCHSSVLVTFVMHMEDIARYLMTCKWFLGLGLRLFRFLVSGDKSACMPSVCRIIAQWLISPSADRNDRRRYTFNLLRRGGTFERKSSVLPACHRDTKSGGIMVHKKTRESYRETSLNF